MRSLITALAALACATPAAADTVGIAALAGSWTFETAPHQATGCVIRGEVFATRSGNALTMRMNAHESCPDREAGINAVEQCRATLQRAALIVRCTLLSADTDSYLADQFALGALSATEMSGRLWDEGIWNTPVTWRRPASPLVS